MNKKKNTYTIQIVCTNCGKGSRSTYIFCGYWIEIPKCKTVHDYLKTVECTNCGCKTLVTH